KAPALHVKSATLLGTYALRMPSSFVYLGGELAFRAVVPSGGTIAISLSDNNGLDWKPLATVTRSGEQKIDLKPFVIRRYDYRLKFVFRGPGTGLDSLKIVHPIQHSQRPLPALTEGANTIRFSSDAEGTVTVEGSTSLGSRSKQLLYTDFHPQRQNIADQQLML